MYYNFQSLFNSKIATEFDSLQELIIDLYNAVKEMQVQARWTKYKDFEEYGFYIDSSDKTKSLFCGMWFDIWETKEIPFCFSLDWKKFSDNKIGHDFESIIKREQNNSLSFLHYDEYPLVGFKAAFFEDMKDAAPVINLLKKIVQELNFGLYFNR